MKPSADVYRRGAADTGPFSRVITSTAEEANELRAVLADLFEPEVLAGLHQRHPAARAAKFLDSLGPSELIRYDAEFDALRSIAGMTLDSQTWRAARDSQSLSKVSDEAWRQVKKRVLNQDQYPDVIAELYVWGFLAQHFDDVALIEEEGKADILIADDEATAVEVKRIKYGTSTSRIRKVIRKSNTQIKNTSGARSGLLFILLERSPTRAKVDDRTPSDVKMFADEIRSCLASGNFRSIEKVILAWDEVEISGSIADKRSLFSFIRNSEIIDHPAPLTHKEWETQAVNARLIQNRSVSYPYDGSSSASDLAATDIAELRFTSEFRTICERIYGIRPAHVEDAVADPSARIDMSYPGSDMTILTKKVTSGPFEYVLLVWGSYFREDGDDPAGPKRFIVLRGYKLWDIAIVPNSEDAYKCFMWFLATYGADVTCGPYTARFIPHVRVVGNGDLNVLGINKLSKPINPSKQKYAGSAYVCLRDDATEGRYVDVTYAFMVEEFGYEQELRRHRLRIEEASREGSGQRVQPRRLTRRQRRKPSR